MKLSSLAARIGGVFQISNARLSLAHCAAVGSTAAMLAFAPAAHAMVVTSPAANLAVPTTTSGIYINVVSGVSGTSPTTVTGWDINPWGTGSPFLYANTGGAIVTSPNSVTAALTVGTSVSSSSTFGTTASGGTATFGTLAGQWTLNATNYFGFSFIGDDTLLHYGYGTMIVGATTLARTVGSLRYESLANTGITVSAVPEPATWALMLGGLSVAGAVARRRRQSAA